MSTTPGDPGLTLEVELDLLEIMLRPFDPLLKWPRSSAGLPGSRVGLEVRPGSVWLPGLLTLELLVAVVEVVEVPERRRWARAGFWTAIICPPEAEITWKSGGGKIC